MAELSTQQNPIQSMYALFTEDKLHVNRRYQRKLVWTLEEKQKLIESILKKYPIPAILVAEREGQPGAYEIIDGLQRLHTILSFIETSFPLTDGRYFNLQHFPTAKGLADEGRFEPPSTTLLLGQKEVSTILDYVLSISVMRNATEEEINDVFDRINTYGHRLSDQERRQAGVQNAFSEMVRDIACDMRGDTSDQVLPLKSMPAISIDLPMTKHGYEVRAEEVFWVNQGVLKSTDLRDSMDEQCIADIAACIVGGELIERSKDALDEIYQAGSDKSNQLLNALSVYGANKFREEFKFCVDEVIAICNEGVSDKLRNILFKNRNTNAFPSIFAVLLIALHELIVLEGKKIANYAGVRKSLTDLNSRLETSRKATLVEERRKNINQIKGLISPYFVSEDIKSKIYGNYATTDIEATIRRSEIELADYELKQGFLSLDAKRGKEDSVIQKVINTICGIANNGAHKAGKIIIGVTDKDADAARIKALDGIDAKKVGERFVVGVAREAKVLGISTEEYVSIWRNAIKNSNLSEALKTSVLSNIDYNSYYGLGVIVITIQPQKELSYVGEYLYWRNGDNTELASSAKQIAQLAIRF